MAHNVTPLTVEQQLSLRNRAKAELIRLEAVYSDEETKEKSTDLKKNSVFARLFIRLYLKIISLTKQVSIWKDCR